MMQACSVDFPSSFTTDLFWFFDADKSSSLLRSTITALASVSQHEFSKSFFSADVHVDIDADVDVGEFSEGVKFGTQVHLAIIVVAPSGDVDFF